MKIKELLNKGNEILKKEDIDEYILKTKLLLSNLLNKNKEYLLIHDEDIVNNDIEEKYFAGIEKLKHGIPIQYIIKKQEFMGFDFLVNENVLIPQPDTEVLVQEILENIKNEDKILDLCTGSGAIGVSIAYLAKEKNIDVCVSDISIDALNVARENIEKNNVNVRTINSNLFENIDEKFNIIVSNPPYIESDCIKNLSIEVKNEPLIALDGGKDGLDFYRKISKNAKLFLYPDGILGLEIGYNQKDSVIEILKKDGYCDIYSKKDYAGNDRIVICRRGE